MGRLAGWTLGILFVLTVMTGRTYAAEYIYYTQSYEPYQLKMAELSDPSNASVIYTSPTGSPYSVAFDESERCIYFSDPHSTVAKIFKAKLDGSSVAPLIEGVHAQGLAVNQENGDLYYAEPDTGTVYKATRGSSGGTIIYSSVGAPRAVAVDPNGNDGNGYLYIADYNLGKIVRTDLDGSDPQTFINEVYATGVSVDSENGKLYYAVAYNPDFYVARVNLTDGLGKETIYTSATGSPRALSVHNKGNSIYFSDWHSTVAKVFRANLTGETGLTNFISSVNAYGLAVITDPPKITSLSPSEGMVTGGITVTITGKGFTGATAVNFGSTPGTNLAVASDTAITVTAPSGSGTVDVRIVAPGGPSEVSAAAKFTYRLPQAEKPVASATTNGGFIKKDAAITLSSETGATVYYTTAVNAEPNTPTGETPTYVSNGGAIILPALTYGDVLKMKAVSVAPGKSLSQAEEFSFTVQQKTSLGLTGITVADKEYDGNTAADANFTAADISEVIGTDSVQLTGTPNAAFADSLAGNNKAITVSGYSLTGIDAEYYTLNQTVTTSAEILPRNLALGSVSVSDKEYDGTATAHVTGIEIASGIVASDNVTVNLSAAAAVFVDGAAVGEGKNVFVSNIQLIGSHKENYSISSTAAAVADILLRTVTTDSVTIADKPYNGNTSATIVGASLNGKAGTEDVSIDYSTASASFDDEKAGTNKIVTVTGLKLGGADRGNYLFSSDSFDTFGRIIPLGAISAPTASLVSGSEIKSGTEITLTAEGNPASTIYYTLGTVQTDPDAGDLSVISGGKVTITGNAGDTLILSVYGTQPGYTDSAIARFTYQIQPVHTLSIIGAGAVSKDYDGTRAAVVTGGTLSGSIVSGDDVALDGDGAYGVFEDRHAGTNKAVEAKGYALTGADSGYYGLQLPALSADIRVRDVSAADIDIEDKVFDGTKSASILGITLNWKADGDDVYVDFSAAEAEFSDSGIENGKQVSISGFALGGTDAGNYYLISADTIAYGNIIAIGTVAAPSAVPGEGSILSGTAITLSTSTSGADIYYTTDGSMPTTGSAVYSDPVTLTGNPGNRVTVKSIAVKTGMTDSGMMEKIYTFIAASNPHNGSNDHDRGGATPTQEPSIRIVNTQDAVSAVAMVSATSDTVGRSTASVTEDQLSRAVDRAIEAAAARGTDAAADVKLEISAAQNSISVTTGIPAAAIRRAADERIRTLTVSTPVASVSFDAETLFGLAKEADEEVRLSAARIDPSELPQEALRLVGSRPVFQFGITSGDRNIVRFEGNVTVSIPYSPEDEEDLNSIVIYYINAEGIPEAVPGGRYDPETGMMTFQTNHFSLYAVGYNPVSFKDVSSAAWYHDAVSFIAAREITTGTGNNAFRPAAKLTRAQFLVMLMKGYSIEPDSRSDADNFIDAGDTWYTDYLSAAKTLGLSDGVGGNRFAPERQITRQELFTLTYNVLKVIDKLPSGETDTTSREDTDTSSTGIGNDFGRTLSSFSDSGEVAPWAENAMAQLVDSGMIAGIGGKLSPKDTSTRAQMAQLLYNLLIQ